MNLLYLPIVFVLCFPYSIFVFLFIINKEESFLLLCRKIFRKIIILVTLFYIILGSYLGYVKVQTKIIEIKNKVIYGEKYLIQEEEEKIKEEMEKNRKDSLVLLQQLLDLEAEARREYLKQPKQNSI